MDDSQSVDELFGGVDNANLASDDDNVASAGSKDTCVATDVALEEDAFSSFAKDNINDADDVLNQQQ